ncbi:MAG: GAF domain-containing protein [Gemmatimonadales bacterium]
MAEEKGTALAPHSTLFGLRRLAVLEIVLALGALLVLDFAFFGGHRYEAIHPHPFWAIVLVSSVYYGTGEGIFAAALSTLALLVGNLPEASFGRDFYGYVLDVSKLPLLWFVSAVVFGELQGQLRREADRIRTELFAARQREEAIAAAYRNLEKLKENLEVRVAGQLRTVFTVYNAAKAIERLGIGDVLVGVAELVRTILAPQKFSLYLLNGNILEAATNEGWEPTDAFAREFEDSTPLFQATVGARRFLNATDEEAEKLLAGEGLIAGPLISVDSGEVVGMLKIEAIHFADFNLSSVENFRLLCEWIGTAFANARRFEVALGASLDATKADKRAF